MHSTMIDSLLTLAASIYMVLVGSGVLPASKDKEKNVALLKKWGVLMVGGGLLIAAWSVFQMVRVA